MYHIDTEKVINVVGTAMRGAYDVLHEVAPVATEWIADRSSQSCSHCGQSWDAHDDDACGVVGSTPAEAGIDGARALLVLAGVDPAEAAARAAVALEAAREGRESVSMHVNPAELPETVLAHLVSAQAKLACAYARSAALDPARNQDRWNRARDEREEGCVAALVELARAATLLIDEKRPSF